MDPTTTGSTTNDPVARGQARFLIPVMVIATTLLSAAFTYGGLLFGALTGLCYEYGPTPGAHACATDGYVLSATFVGTLAIPLGIGLWARRAHDTPRTIARIAACLAGYLIPVIVFLATAGS